MTGARMPFRYEVRRFTEAGTAAYMRFMNKAVADRCAKSETARTGVRHWVVELIGCEVHPAGTHEPCHACGRARLDAALRRDDEPERAIRGDVKAGGATVREIDFEHRGSAAHADALKLILDMRQPEVVRSLRIEIEHGPVVVELHSHAAEPIRSAA